MKGIIFNIQRFSLQDGPGIRTTVFIKGCPLRCKWCHNPESWRMQPEISYNSSKCIGCGNCVKVCPNGVHAINKKGIHTLMRSNCTLCGKCILACPYEALEIAGAERSVHEVIAEALKDKPFYQASGGGLTLSGGEPFSQPEFTYELLREAKAEALHTCLETCGHAPWEDIRRTMEYTDLYLYDYKMTDPEKHKAMTGVDNKNILANLHRLLAQGAAIVLRCPMIEGINDTTEHLKAIAALYKQYPMLRGIEIMAYHNLGVDKGTHVGIPADQILQQASTPESVKESWLKTLHAYGCEIAKLG